MVLINQKKVKEEMKMGICKVKENMTLINKEIDKSHPDKSYILKRIETAQYYSDLIAVNIERLNRTYL